MSLFRCAACGHAIAEHAPATDASRDYHDQYGPEFAQALERTRRRQARRITDALHDVGVRDGLVDFGCGRGWFLDESRKRGVSRIAGLDTSALAVSLLGASGCEAHLLPLPDGGQWRIPAAQLSFAAEGLTLLDVIEHFPPDQIRGMFQAIVSAFGATLKWLVVKVPVSSGLLYRTTLAAARAGATGALYQMYQVGTFPPHYHYFSKQSVRLFLTTMGLTVIRAFGDADFDVIGFQHRVALLSKPPAVFGRTAGAALWTAVTATRQFDSLIVIARVT